MDESRAWLGQARSDFESVGLHVDGRDDRTHYCHAIAKCQQTVEKAVKALVQLLNEAGKLHTDIGWRHSVERFMSVLVRLPRTPTNRDLANLIGGLFDGRTRSEIRVLDNHAPKRPGAGRPAPRNTEYPFRRQDGAWGYPAQPDVFTREELQRFRELAHRVLDGCHRVMSAIARSPS
jgi:HEPN domain-containing protein